MLNITATGRYSKCASNEVITAGSVGIPAVFNLNEDYDGLSPVAVFRGSGLTFDVALITSETVIPHEVLEQAGGILEVGVYARNGEGNIVIPTVWSVAGTIREGAKPSGVNPSEPTPDWTAQVQAAATEAVSTANEAKTIAEAAEEAAISGAESASASAAAALQSETNASTSAASALESANSAARSAFDASISEQNAADSAEDAINASDVAEQAASRSATSAQEAESSKQSAAASANTATAAEQNASVYASGAETAKIVAETAARNADISEVNASNSATEANVAAAQADNSAEAASSSEQNAAESAQHASVYEASSLSAATSANAAKDAAELAKNRAVTAETNATAAASTAVAAGNIAQTSAQIVEEKCEEFIESIPDFQNDINKKAPAIYKSIGPLSVIAFDDGADNVPVKSFTVDILFTQEGSGNPSPSNIRNFTTYTHATISQAGADVSEPVETIRMFPSEIGQIAEGTWDVLSGEMEYMRGLAVFDGSDDEQWTAREDLQHTFVINMPAMAQTGVATWKLFAANQLYNSSRPSAAASMKDHGMYTNASHSFFVRFDELTTVTELCAYLAEHPLQVVYPIQGRPLTAQLEPIDICTLPGANTFWSDAGKATVEYVVDTKTYVDEMQVDIDILNDEASSMYNDISNMKEMLATVELEDYASKDYAVGDLLVYEGKLYKVTSPISLGSTLIADGNIEQTTVEDLLFAAVNDGPVDDVRINGTSIVNNGIANIPVSGANTYGVMKNNADYGVFVNYNGYLQTSTCSTEMVKAGANVYRTIKPYNQHESTFYGLAKAAGDTTQSQSSNGVGTYTDAAKAAIQTMLNVPDKSDIPEVPVDDVQIDGTSIVNNGVASIPYASQVNGGVVKIIENGSGGFQIAGGYLLIKAAELSSVKAGSVTTLAPIVPGLQDAAAFYGLAKAAGDTTQAASSNTVGQYTDGAKSAIHDMLNAPVTVSGTTPTIAAKSGISYVCGEVSTLTITLPASGIFDVCFTSGSTPTVLTANGVTWPAWFDPTALEANTIYEINVLDGLAVVVSWEN